MGLLNSDVLELNPQQSEHVWMDQRPHVVAGRDTDATTRRLVLANIKFCSCANNVKFDTKITFSWTDFGFKSPRFQPLPVHTGLNPLFAAVWFTEPSGTFWNLLEPSCPVKTWFISDYCCDVKLLLMSKAGLL